MISRNMYKTGAVLMALVTAFTVTGLSGCKSRTVSNEVTTEYDIPDDYNDERPGVTYGNVDFTYLTVFLHNFTRKWSKNEVKHVKKWCQN